MKISSINVISKIKFQHEPAIAFRIFKNLLEEKYGIDGEIEFMQQQIRKKVH